MKILAVLKTTAELVYIVNIRENGNCDIVRNNEIVMNNGKKEPTTARLDLVRKTDLVIVDSEYLQDDSRAIIYKDGDEFHAYNSMTGNQIKVKVKEKDPLLDKSIEELTKMVSAPKKQKEYTQAKIEIN